MHARGAHLALGLLLALASFLWAPRPAVAASEGTGLYVGPTALPWIENQVTVDVALGLARGEVHQRFWNNTGRTAEAVYVFPLPTGAVVTGMSMEVGGTHIDGVIAPRAAAAAGYERAIAGGHAAALTERERPGVYTQSVAGIPADGTVVVTLRWQARLTRRQGEWELAHPLVVGPRYTPGQATGAPVVGAGTSPDTDRAPDASRMTPPRDRAASMRFVVTVTLHGAGAVTSPTHTLTLGHGDDSVIASIDDPRGNRELVLRWRRAGLGSVRAFAEPTATGTYVAVLVEPPPAAAAPRHTPRSWLVAIDRSASMTGAAEAQARRLAHAVIASLGPGDRAAVVAIGSAPRWEGADAAARAALDERVDHLPKTGGDLTAGLATTLARLPKGPPVAVVLVTDGLVADDAAAIARATAAHVVIHPVGVGAAPNRWLLEAIAAGTRGSSHVAIDPDDAEVIAAELVAAADAQPVAIDWRRPSVIDAEPTRAVVVPGGSALIVAIDRTSASVPDAARSGGASAPAMTAGGPTSLGEVEVVVDGEHLRAPIELVHGTELPTEWARQRITELEATGQGAAATRLALDRGLVSSTTALVAVAPTAGDVVQSTVTVPLPLPAGLRPESVADSSGDVFDLAGKPTELPPIFEPDPFVPAGGEDQAAAARRKQAEEARGANGETVVFDQEHTKNREGRPATGVDVDARDHVDAPPPPPPAPPGATKPPKPPPVRDTAKADADKDVKPKAPAGPAHTAPAPVTTTGTQAPEKRWTRTTTPVTPPPTGDAGRPPSGGTTGGARTGGNSSTDTDGDGVPDDASKEPTFRLEGDTVEGDTGGRSGGGGSAGDGEESEDSDAGDDRLDDDEEDPLNGSTRTAAAPAPESPDYADEGVASYETLATRSAARGRHGVTLSVALGARLDDVAPAGQLSLGLDRRLAHAPLFAGLRLDVTGAPSADRPLSASLLVTLARNLGTIFTLDGGLGAAFDGRFGLGYAAGLTAGRGPLGLQLRFSSTATSGPDPSSLTTGVTVGF